MYDVKGVCKLWTIPCELLLIRHGGINLYFHCFQSAIYKVLVPPSMCTYNDTYRWMVLSSSTKKHLIVSSKNIFDSMLITSVYAFVFYVLLVFLLLLLMEVKAWVIVYISPGKAFSILNCIIRHLYNFNLFYL